MPRETLLQISLFLRRKIPVAVSKSQLYVSSQPHPTLISLSIHSRLYVSSLNGSHYQAFVNVDAAKPKTEISPFTLKIHYKLCNHIMYITYAVSSAVTGLIIYKYLIYI